MGTAEIKLKLKFIADVLFCSRDSSGVSVAFSRRVARKKTYQPLIHVNGRRFMWFSAAFSAQSKVTFRMDLIILMPDVFARLRSLFAIKSRIEDLGIGFTTLSSSFILLRLRSVSSARILFGSSRKTGFFRRKKDEEVSFPHFSALMRKRVISHQHKRLEKDCRDL